MIKNFHSKMLIGFAIIAFAMSAMFLSSAILIKSTWPLLVSMLFIAMAFVASMRAKLLNLSRARGVPLNALMERYATGRFLFRLAESDYRERFVLKGAQLFRIWEMEEHRPTRDLDLLGYGESTLALAFNTTRS